MVNKEKKAGDDWNFTRKKWNKNSENNFFKKIRVKRATRAQIRFLDLYDTGLNSWLSMASMAIFTDMFKGSIDFLQYFSSSFFHSQHFLLKHLCHHLCQIFLLTFLALEVLHLSGSLTKQLSSIILISFQIPCTFRETCKSGSLLLSANLLALFYIVLSDT